MQRCDHEEADTRIAVHVVHALNKKHNQVLIRTVDTVLSWSLFILSNAPALFLYWL